MKIKKTVFMSGAFAFFLSLACMGATGMSGGGCGTGSGACGSGCSQSQPQLTQAIINQCTAAHTTPCLSQTSCQYVCDNNPNMPGGANQPCPSGQ